jgi:hypothetical protein
MATLTEILADYARIMLDVDAAEGEVTDDIADRLAAAEGDLTDKVERIERLCESLTATARAVRDRAARQVDHARAMEARAERIHGWAVQQLELAGLSKFDAGDFQLARRASPPRLNVIEQDMLRSWLLDNHPETVKIVEEIDKRAVLALAKEAGGEIPGAEVVRGTHWRVM